MGRANNSIVLAIPIGDRPYSISRNLKRGPDSRTGTQNPAKGPKSTIQNPELGRYVQCGAIGKR
jgi:hypothetical protein